MLKTDAGNIGEAFAGRVAGVQVTSNEGMPGEEMNIVIRGSNSITQSNSPLYVIDGFPLEDTSMGALNPRTSLRSAFSKTLQQPRYTEPARPTAW